MKARAKVTYDVEPSASYSIKNIVSYADIRLGNMRTFSGDVFKAKVYVRAEGSFFQKMTKIHIGMFLVELMLYQQQAQ